MIEGWGRKALLTLDMLPEKDRLRMESRLKICHTCPVRHRNKCAKNKYGRHLHTNKLVHGCGCPLEAATLSPSKRCPLGKW